MKQREHTSDEGPGPQAGPAGGAGNLNAAREAATAFFAAGDAAINKALSGDSEQFNQSVRQDGGQ